MADVISHYLFEEDSKNHRTYKFCYAERDPSGAYLRHKIFKEKNNSLKIKNTFYTSNLRAAKKNFDDWLKKLRDEEGSGALQNIYTKLTKEFLFNEYVIKDTLDVCVA